MYGGYSFFQYGLLNQTLQPYSHLLKLIYETKEEQKRVENKLGAKQKKHVNFHQFDLFSAFSNFGKHLYGDGDMAF